MTTVFISYSRERYGEVKSLVEDLGALGHQAWFDHELTGGQAWWDQVLLKIRECEVFAYGLSPESLDSLACKREYAYASKLGKSVLPILVADGVSSELLPAALEELQYVDYRREDKEALKALSRALVALPRSPPAPDPLPEPPAAPVSYLGSLAEQLGATLPLSFQQQTELVLRLKHGLRDTKDGERVRTLLRRFRSREDLFARVADEIDALFKSTPAGPDATPVNDNENVPVGVVAPRVVSRPVDLASSVRHGGELSDRIEATERRVNETTPPMEAVPLPTSRPPTTIGWIKTHIYVQLACGYAVLAACLGAYDSDLRLAGTLISTLVGIPASLILGRLSWKVRFPMGVIQGWVVPILFGAIVGSCLGGASLSSWLDIPVLVGDVELVLAAALLTTSAVLAFMLLRASKRRVQTHRLLIEATGSGP